MVTEFAEIDVIPGKEQDFIAGYRASRDAFLGFPGCHGLTLQRGVEDPAHFVLMVQWETVADHLEKFRNAPEFQIWRANVGPFFASLPNVWHGEEVT